MVLYESRQPSAVSNQYAHAFSLPVASDRPLSSFVVPVQAWGGLEKFDTR
jgi:hypothetical protein